MTESNTNRASDGFPYVISGLMLVVAPPAFLMRGGVGWPPAGLASPMPAPFFARPTPRGMGSGMREIDR